MDCHWPILHCWTSFTLNIGNYCTAKRRDRIALRDFMECGGKRSATPLWLERFVLRWLGHKHKPKRRRASLAAALHMAVAESNPLLGSGLAYPRAALQSF